MISKPLRIEYVPIQKLKKWSLNPRLMPDDQANALAKSLQKFDVVEPLVIDQHDRICGGHQRYDQLLALGVKSVPCVRKHLSGREFKALNLALNRISGEWDNEKLAPLLAELRELPEIDLTGFSPQEIDELIRAVMPETNINEDEVPEPPSNPITTYGAIWKLGKHRILCGDATKEQDLETLTEGAKAALCVTDPPYGEQYELSNKFVLNDITGEQEHHKSWGEISGDEAPDTAMQSLPIIFSSLAENGSVYIFCGKKLLVAVANWLDAHNIHYPPFLVWDKGFAVVTWQRYHAEHELIIWCGPGSRPGAYSYWFGPKNETTMWRIPLDASGKKRQHPTQKPVALIERAIINSSQRGDLILDPFLGSGTTLIAAEKLARVCFGIEIEPRYVDVAVKRWETFTGSKAQLARS